MLTLFHSPGSCSMGVVFLLEQARLRYELRVVSIRDGQHKRPEYLQLNPKGKLPALILPGGSVLTEFQAIAFWIGKAAELWPADVEAQARTLALLDFIVGSLHMRGLTLIKVPRKFHQSLDAQRTLAEFGRSEVQKGIGFLSGELGEQKYLLGRFGPADAAAFYALLWCKEEGLILPANLIAYQHRLMAMPGADKALQA